MTEQTAHTPDLIGHEPQRRMLARLVKNGRLPSTMLFAGPAGVGKRAAAFELARSLFCTGSKSSYGGCGACKECRLVAAGNFPDCIAVDCRDRETFDLD